jgi:hypothetical protein
MLKAFDSKVGDKMVKLDSATPNTKKTQGVNLESF